VALQGFHKRERGFTLITVIVLLAVLLTVIALVVPSTVQQVSSARQSDTLDEMEVLQVAMLGNRDLPSTAVRSDFGYLGDMGNLAATLDDLVTQGAQPAYSFDSAKRAGAGWKGPYFIRRAGGDAASHKRDAFGNDYIYDTSDYTNGQGQLVDAKLVSLGADGLAGGTGPDEDITFEILKAKTLATVTGNVEDQIGDPAAGVNVAIHYPANGTLTSQAATTDVNGVYQFSNIPFGLRGITLEPTITLVAGSVTAFGSGNRHLRFSVENVSGSDMTIRFLNATYNVSAFYDEIRWQGSSVYNCPGSGPAGSSGGTLTLDADQTVAAASGMAPLLVEVNAGTVQASDITLQAGTQATIELRLFRANTNPCPSGPVVSMSGVTFTDVTLRNPSNQIVGQFSFTVP
jgi:type II secretory pathway pseudopilin PulG